MGWEEYYEVSSHGRVRSVTRTLIDGRVRQGQPMRVTRDTRGYGKVVLSRNGGRRYVHVHRLVAEAFIPNPESKPYVLHWNDLKSDNQVENLRWGTASENMADAVRNGVHPETKVTHCPRDHPYSLDNTFYDRKNRRGCRECRKQYHRRLREEAKSGTRPLGA